MMVIVEQLVEWRLAGETEVLGENLPQPYFVHHKSHMTWPGLEPGPPRWDTERVMPQLVSNAKKFLAVNADGGFLLAQGILFYERRSIS
jgi:hypothetical protein